MSRKIIRAGLTRDDKMFLQSEWKTFYRTLHCKRLLTETKKTPEQLWRWENWNVYTEEALLDDRHRVDGPGLEEG